MNTSNTFYSSTNETKVLLASLTTILESLNPIRSLINTRPKSKTFYSSTSDKNCHADFITRKIETLGSIFSHETEGLLASPTTILESLYVNYKESSTKNPNFLKALSISSKSCFVSASTK